MTYSNYSSIMEVFEISIDYKGKYQMFNVSLQVTGYTHKILVEIENEVVTFESNEERNYRAVLTQQQNDNISVDRNLLIEIASFLQKLLS